MKSILTASLSLFSLLLIFLGFNSENSGKNSEPIQKEQLTVEYIAHASFLLEHEGTTILLDPFADKVWLGYSFPKGVTADAIFSTHPHYDHDGGLFLEHTPYWKNKIPLYQDTGSYTVGAFEITGFKGKHSEPYGKEFGQKNTIWMIEAGETRLLHWGDNGPASDEMIESFGRVDILMIPMDSTYHILKKDETESMITAINPKVIIPMHYKHPDLEDGPGKPKNLGPIEPVLQGKENAMWLQSNSYPFGDISKITQQTYIIFKHSPDVKR